MDPTNSSIVAEDYERNYNFNIGDPQRVETIFEAVFYIVGTLGVVSNIFVLFFLGRLGTSHRSLVLILNQCAIDIFSCACLVLTYGFMFHEKEAYTGVSGKVYCHLLWSEALLFVGLQASTFNMVAMSVERLLLIVYPLYHRRFFTHHRAYVAVVIVWVLGVLVNIPTYLMTSLDTTYHHCEWGLLMDSQKLTFAYGILDLAYSYLVPLVVLISSYTHMLVTLHRNQKKRYSLYSLAPLPTISHTLQPHTVMNKPCKVSTAQLNLFRMMVLLTICFVLCWSPGQAYFFASVIGEPLSFSDALYYLCLTLTLLNSSLNVAIYTAVNRPLRNCIKETFTSSKNITISTDTGISNA